MILFGNFVSFCFIMLWLTKITSSDKTKVLLQRTWHGYTIVICSSIFYTFWLLRIHDLVLQHFDYAQMHQCLLELCPISFSISSVSQNSSKHISFQIIYHNAPSSSAKNIILTFWVEKGVHHHQYLLPCHSAKRNIHPYLLVFHLHDE